MAKIKKHLNRLCDTCLHDCKQNADMEVVICAKFTPQLELKFKSSAKKKPVSRKKKPVLKKS